VVVGGAQLSLTPARGAPSPPLAGLRSAN
jgi:hypothetical protein